MKNLEQKLEEVKQLGAYSVNLFFGEGEGSDDSNIPMMKREVKMICQPVGYLGSMRALFKGTLEEFLEFDLSQEPKQISNPPKREEYEESGWYCWGTDSAIERQEINKTLFPFVKKP